MDNSLLQWLIIIFAVLGGYLCYVGNNHYKENQKLIKKSKVSDDKKQQLSKLPISVVIGGLLLIVASYLFLMYITELKLG